MEETASKFESNAFLSANWHPNYFLLYIFFVIMGETATCQNLSNYHVVIWWRNLSPLFVARELISFENRCPPSTREACLTGVTRIILFVTDNETMSVGWVVRWSVGR